MKKQISFVFFSLLSFYIFAASNIKNNKAEDIIRQPVMRITEDGYRLIWNDNKNSKLKFAKAGEKAVTVLTEKNFINGKLSGFYADFSNLEPNQKYFYKISGHKKVFFYSPKSTQEGFKFAAISDHQTFTELTEKGFKIVAEEHPDFILSAGDMLEDGKVLNWQKNFFEKLPVIEGIPFAAAEGNNDSGFRLFQQYLCLDNRYYSCLYGNTRIILLSSNLPLREGAEQYIWLEELLKNNESLWTVVIFHIGPFLSTDPDYSTIKFRTALVPLLERYKVDLVLNGHNHLYDRTTPINGITYISLPTLSGKLSKVSANTDSGYYAKTVSGVYGYGVFYVSDSQISFIIKDLDGNIIDESEIKK